MDETGLGEPLAALARRIRACRICRDAPRGAPLPHEPRPVFRISRTARLCICSQAPGTRVHASGTPFTDASGDRLRDWLGVTSDEFYDVSRIAIVPMGFCFPGLDAKGGDLPPRRECAPAWRAGLFEALPQFELVVLVGSYAQSWHLGGRVKGSLTETVAHWRDYLSPGGGTSYLPTPHPSWRNNGWLRRQPWFAAEVLPYLRAEVRRLLLPA
ncbi:MULTISPECIES: uracil-DNA glycosylase family protein [Rhodomicrobium]|uniref:uracil-DNA glycosylase family protein n=1 Tax=Rhodomicrobium TaxID=1068 RepID=UPI000B4BB263|nr:MULTISPECIES: uracil-DNA glycosylase family protein [Rhodomicrobium]